MIVFIKQDKRKRQKTYNTESWKKLKHSNKGHKNKNKKLVNENELLHQIQQERLKQNET